MINLFLQIWDIFFGLFLFEQIKDSDFVFVVDVVLDEVCVNIVVIIEQVEVMFVNMIEVLENVDQLLDCVLSVFYFVVGVYINLECEVLLCEFVFKFVVYLFEIIINIVLFQWIDYLW